MIPKNYPALNIENIRNIRGHNYYKLCRAYDKIPECSGVYIWRYWPDIPSLDSEIFLDFIENLQKKFPNQIDKLRNTKMNVTVCRTPFGQEDDEKMLGIKNKIKQKKILDLLNKNDKTKQAFAHTLELIISSCPPIYIGKANNIRSRLKNHFENKTDLVSNIESAGMDKEDIYISYIEDDLDDNDVTTVIEEIYQRLTNPAYTKRYG